MMQSILALTSVLMLQVATVFCQNGAAAVSPGSSYRVLSLASNESAFLQVLPDGTYRGFVWDLLNTLKEMIGFKFTLEVQADGQYGQLDSYGNWNGMINQLLSNNFDIIAAGDYSVKADRESVTDFTTPHLCSHVVRVTQPGASLDNIKYAAYRGTSIAQFLQSSVDPAIQAIWTNIEANAPTSLVGSAIEGLALVRQGGWAFVAPESGVALTVDSSNGQLVITGTPLLSEYFALGVRLGSYLPDSKPLASV